MSKYDSPPPPFVFKQIPVPPKLGYFLKLSFAYKNFCKLNVKYDMKVNSFVNKNKLSNFLLPTRYQCFGSGFT